MLTSQERGIWLQTLNWLRANHRSKHPVVVRSVKMRRDRCGDTELRCRLFLIRINSTLPLQSRVDTLLHEWAHAMAWYAPEHNDDHGPEWGVAHARIYSAWEKWTGEGK